MTVTTVAALGFGCATATSKEEPSFTSTVAGSPQHADSQHASRQRPVTRGSRIQTALVALGAVPYDEFALPLVHPEGRFVATQVGIAPRWPTTLAAPGAPVPEATTIEIRALSPNEPAQLVRRLPPPILLGRGADRNGFLVEQPLDDGSRRIGMCPWDGAEIEWIADDGSVNAHAALGPDGAVTWSRRSIDRAEFDLVVLDRSAGAERSLRSVDGESWLLPQFSRDGTLLLALRLRDGVLQATAIRRGDAAAMRQSVRTLTLTNRGTVAAAFQSVAPQAGARASIHQPAESFLLFHPAEGRMILWSPRDGRVQAFRSGSIGATFIAPQRILVSLADGIRVESLDDGAISHALIDGTCLARVVDGESWPVVLLQPGQASVSITGMGIMNLEDGIVSGR